MKMCGKEKTGEETITMTKLTEGLIFSQIPSEYKQDALPLRQN
jgi:hypothetical protein